MMLNKHLMTTFILLGFSFLSVGCQTTPYKIFSDNPRIADVSNRPIKRQPIPDNLEHETTIIVPADVLFEINTAILKPGAYSLLNHVVAITQNYPHWNVHVSGNTDPINSDLKFKHVSLSLQQAQKVAGYLWEKELPITKLTYSGDKARNPIATNKKLSGMRTNRRIQITIYPPTSKRD